MIICTFSLCVVLVNSSLLLMQDGNIPSGESFVRQFLLGQIFFKKEFGNYCKEVRMSSVRHDLFVCLVYCISPYVVLAS